MFGTIPFSARKRELFGRLFYELPPVAASQPSIPTQNTSEGFGSPGGPAVLGPHLAATGRPPGCDTEHPPKGPPLQRQLSGLSFRNYS